MTGDNPASTTAVAKCIYPQVGANNQFLSVRNHGFVWFDNFEWTGMCSATQENAANNYLFRWNVYLNDQGGSNIPVQNIYSNMYAHGWTHLPFQCSHIGGQSVGICETNTFIVSGLMTTFGPGNVCDGGDSDPTGVICMAPPGPGYLVYDNVFANQAQMVVNGCHVWHDNLWFGYTFSGDGVAHGNQWECNSSAPQNDPNGHPQAPTTHNVFYNNVVGHNSAGTDGDVKIQFAVNSTYPWFVFNNVIYDQGRSNQLNWGGTGVTLPTGQQFFFNNTYEAATSGDVPSCYAGMTYVNNLIIAEGGTYFAGPGGCRGGNNIGMNHASAIKQGYMASHTGTSGNNSNTTCANDITPCAETSSGNPTVGAGANLLAYCNTLLASSDGTIQRAGAACKNGTSYACSYDTNTHSVNCPREAPVARPATTAWDVGASQFATPQTQNGGTVPR